VGGVFLLWWTLASHQSSGLVERPNLLNGGKEEMPLLTMTGAVEHLTTKTEAITIEPNQSKKTVAVSPVVGVSK
jgi:hypothetical protein